MENIKAENGTTADLHIFKNEEYTKDGLEKELAIFGLSCFYLAIAVDASEGNNDSLSKRFFGLADDLGYHGESWAYNTIRNSAMADVVFTKNRRDTEARYYDLFEKHLHKVFDESTKVIEGHSNAKNKPDKWIEINGVEIPVEMKKGEFDAKALKQLQRYMSVFNSVAGVAVGSHMTVDCPTNVIFVPTSTLDYWESLETKKISLDEILDK